MLSLSCLRSELLLTGWSRQQTGCRRDSSFRRSQVWQRYLLRQPLQSHLLSRLCYISGTIEELLKVDTACSGLVYGIEGLLGLHDLSFVHLTSEVNQKELREPGIASHSLQSLKNVLDVELFEI